MTLETLSIDNITDGDRLKESVLERAGIAKNDFPKSLGAICLEKNIDPDFVLNVLKCFDASEKEIVQSLSPFSIEAVMEYLRKTHDYYLNTKLPEIDQTIYFLKKDFSESHPILVILSELFTKYKSLLVQHIRNEEEFLFPYIDYLRMNTDAEAELGKEYYNKYSIQQFMSDHNDPEDGLTKIRGVILNHSQVKEDVMPFQIFLNQIENFERDLRTHAIIEDSVLLPKAIELEKKLGMVG